MSDNGQQDTQSDLVDCQLLRVKEAAGLLAVSRSTVYGMMDAGVLRYVSIGRARRIRRSVIKEFISRRETGGWSADQETAGNLTTGQVPTLNVNPGNDL